MCNAGYLLILVGKSFGRVYHQKPHIAPFNCGNRTNYAVSFNVLVYL